MNSILTPIILAPLVGALFALLIPRNYRFVIRSVALLATFTSMVLAMKMFFFDFVTGSVGREQLSRTRLIRGSLRWGLIITWEWTD